MRGLLNTTAQLAHSLDFSAGRLVGPPGPVPEVFIASGAVQPAAETFGNSFPAMRWSPLSRLVLAFKLFFLVLFNRRIAEAVGAAYEAARSGKEVPAAKAPPPPKEGPGKKPVKTTPTGPGLGAVAAVLSLLQREARFVDFLMEDIEPYPDAQVGMASRGVHRGCRKALKDYIELKPVRTEKEGDDLTVEPGFDPGAIRLIGNVTGAPPFQGKLVHPGWRIVKAEVPIPPANQDESIVMPAEVEI